LLASRSWRTSALLLHGDTSRPAGDDGTVAELADLLREHFSTPVPRYYGGPAADPPNRLVYLLDHEYTPRSLKWSRLKGADAAELPVTHQTRRQGRPYTLVLKKTEALFAREEGARIRDETDLEWLAAQWNLRA
jgi:hypothetical protein